MYHVNVNFSWKRPIISMNYFERIFQKFWPQIKKQILYRTCLTKQSFLNKITTGWLWNLSFLEFCMHLIANFTCKDTMKESGIVIVESFSCGLLRLNPGARGGDHLASQLAWAAACISHMHLPCLPSRWV